MLTEMDFVSYKDFVEGLTEASDFESNDKIVVSNLNGGPKSIVSILETLKNGGFNVVKNLEASSSTYSTLAEVMDVPDTGYYDIECFVDGGYTVNAPDAENGRNVLTIAVVKPSNEERWFDCLGTTGRKTRLNGEKTIDKSVYAELGDKIVIKGRCTCKFNISVRKSDSLKSKELNNSESINGFPSIRSLMSRGGIYITSGTNGVWEYNSSGQSNYDSRIRTKTDVAIHLYPGDVIHTDRWDVLTLYVGYSKQNDTGAYIVAAAGESGWRHADVTVSVEGFYVFQGRLLSERNWASEDEMLEFIDSVKIIRQGQSVPDIAGSVHGIKDDLRNTHVGVDGISKRISLVSDTSFKKLAEIFEADEDGYYDVNCKIIGSYTLTPTSSGAYTNNVFTINVMNPNVEQVSYDCIATLGFSTMLSSKFYSKKVFVAKGNKICIYGRITCYIDVNVRKSESIESVTEENTKLLSVNSISSLFERGGIYTQPTYWEYNHSGDSYFDSRFRTKEGVVLKLKAGDKIHSDKFGDGLVIYVGYKNNRETSGNIITGWHGEDVTAPVDGDYVVTARLSTERDWASEEEMQSFISSMSIISVEKTLAEKVEIAYEGIKNNPISIPFAGEIPALSRRVNSELIADADMTGFSTALNGLAIYGNKMVSLAHTGMAKVYSISNNFNIEPLTGAFQLASYSTTLNHANCGSFSNQFYDEGDALPLLYITQYIDGYHKCFVERIDVDNESSSLIQTITIADGLFNYSCDFVIDRERNRLVVWGNTENSSSATNKHRVMEFNIPSTESSEVTLSASDAIVNYCMEDFSDDVHTMLNGSRVFSVQGSFAHNGVLYCLASGSDEQVPATTKSIYVWDIVNKSLLSNVDLSYFVPGELEDMDVFNGSIVIQSGYGKDAYYRLNL